MSEFSKQNQIKKTKRINPKKMPNVELTIYKVFIHDKQKGLCFCGCGRSIDEYHHAFFGINKDDRYLVGIAQHPCHYAIHHGKDMGLKRRLILLSENKGKENWKDYTL